MLLISYSWRAGRRGVCLPQPPSSYLHYTLVMLVVVVVMMVVTVLVVDTYPSFFLSLASVSCIQATRTEWHVLVIFSSLATSQTLFSPSFQPSTVLPQTYILIRLELFCALARCHFMLVLVVLVLLALHTCPAGCLLVSCIYLIHVAWLNMSVLLCPYHYRRSPSGMVACF